MSEINSESFGRMKLMISIIMPTYNRLDYICASIDSVLNQTYANLELIVVDDGSTDATRSGLEKYEEDPRFRYYYQCNQGQSKARNKGINEARGEFIAFLDSDDIWVLDKLEKQIVEAEKYPDCDIFYGDCIIIDANGAEISRKNMKKHSGYITRHLLKDNFVSMGTTLTRKHCFDELGGLSEKVQVADDYELWLRLSSKYKFYYSPQYYTKYRVMENQISSNKDRRFKSNEKVLFQFFKKYPDIVNQAEKMRGLSFFYVRKARYEISRRNNKRAVFDIMKAIKLDPGWSGPWRAFARMVINVFSKSSLPN